MLWLNGSKSPADCFSENPLWLNRCYSVMPCLCDAQVFTYCWHDFRGPSISFSSDITDRNLNLLDLVLTFIQPIGKAIKHNFLFPGGNQADGSALHRCSVVDVVFKNEDLERETHRGEWLLLSVGCKVEGSNWDMCLHRADSYLLM